MRLPERGRLAGEGDHSHHEEPVGHRIQEDAGSFLGVLTAEEISVQTKGSVQSELQGKILGGPEGGRGSLNLERENMCAWSSTEPSCGQLSSVCQVWSGNIHSS